MRRIIIGGLAVVLLTGHVTAQQPAKVPRVGILTPAEDDRTAIFQAFRQGLREHGYIEGQNIVLEFRLARGDYGMIPRLAAELASLPVDVIVTDGGPVAQAARAATATIPIVMGTSGDPFAQGLITSLARPGGNVTGFTLSPTELSVKRLDLLRAAFPDAKSATVILNPLNPGSEAGFRAVSDAARSFGLVVVRVEGTDPDSLRGLSPGSIDRAAPVLVLPDAMLWNQRQQLIALVTAARVPALYPEREYAEDGGLMAYGPNVPENFRQAATYVDRILKGANPGELPVQQPAKLDFIINLKAAQALGLLLPAFVLARATEVIE